jgi:hypothetical protein
MPVDFKGTVYQKNRMGHYILAQKNNFRILFFSNLFKKLLSACMGNTLNGEKVLKLNIPRLVIENHEINFRSSTPDLDRFDPAKKPSHATVPLNKAF